MEFDCWRNQQALSAPLVVSVNLSAVFLGVENNIEKYSEVRGGEGGGMLTLSTLPCWELQEEEQAVGPPGWADLLECCRLQSSL